MKKFILGMLCGALVTIPISVMASTQITASIFPCKVTIQKEGSSVSLLNSTESPFLLYNDRTYVPIRSLTEAIGYQVDFVSALTENNNINQVNLREKAESTGQTSAIQDKDQIVSIVVTDKEFTKDSNNTVRISGNIIVNKDISGKTVQYAQTFAIENELFEPLKKGQTRKFTATMQGDTLKYYTPEIISIDWNAAKIYPDYIAGLAGKANDLDFIFLGVYGDNTSLSHKGYSRQCIQLRNKSKKSLDIKNAQLHYQITKLENGKEIIVCDYQLPNNIGTIPAANSKDIIIPTWNFKDSKGNTQPVGKYKEKLYAEKEIEYTLFGETAIKKIALKGNVINEENLFTFIE